jgi:hypothetical protein
MTTRLVTASAHIDGTDDETFGSNEFGSASFTRETVLNDSQPQNLIEMVCKWGGECRVELELTGQRLNDDGVRIDGHAKMFEGTSEETDDFDGQTLFQFVVPKGRTVGNSQTVRNEDEGGDFADISMTVSNVILEDVDE